MNRPLVVIRAKPSGAVLLTVRGWHLLGWAMVIAVVRRVR